MHSAKSKVSGMISKGFKPEKCKVSLRMAMSRMKLLRNKREVQVRQMRRDVAQLLQSGQDQTAHIRVEHVIREEKTMAAYELLELYCELIVARLPIIDSQKTCPIDLQEAISSVIFASPRCADVQELTDVRKQFLSKYGKEFTTAALELRPDCHVSHMLIDKLSAKAPDTETKIKTLNSIAEEHGIKWDSKALLDELQKPTNDLLMGSTQYSGASQVTMNPSANSSVNTSSQPKPTQFLSASQVAMGYWDTNSSATIDQMSSEPKPTEFISASEVTVGHSDFSSSTNTNSGSTSFVQPKNEDDNIDSDDAEPPDDPVPPHGGILSSTGSFIYPPPPPPFMRFEESAPSSTHPDLISPADSSRQEKTKHNYKDAREAARAAAESAEQAQIAAKAAADLARHEKKARGKAHENNTYTIPDASVEDAQKQYDTKNLKMHNDQVSQDFDGDEEEEEDITTHLAGPGTENEYVWDTPKPSSVAVFDQGDSDIDDHPTNLLDTFSQLKEDDFTSSHYYWGEKADNRKQDRIESMFFEDSTKDSSQPQFASSSAPAFDSDGMSSENEAEHYMNRNKGRPRYIYDEEREEKKESAFASGMKNMVSSDNDNDEADLGFKFGKLTGGLRNKGYVRPPFVKKSITDATPSVETLNDHDVYYSSRTRNTPTSDVHEDEDSYVVSVESEKSERGQQKLAPRFDTNQFDREHAAEPENQQVEIGRRTHINIIKQSRTQDPITPKIRKEVNSHFGENLHPESSDEETTNESVVAKKLELDEDQMKSSAPPSTSGRPRRPPDYETLAAHFRSLRTNRS